MRPWKREAHLSAGAGTAVPSHTHPQPSQQQDEEPAPTRPLTGSRLRQGQQEEQSSTSVPPTDYAASHSHGVDSAPAAAPVTPDEVVTLGVLALAGLWPGCWSGIAAIIVHKVEWLTQSGVVDEPFRRCAQSLVDSLLRSTGEASLAAETWQRLSDAQARLPGELGQVLCLACSLLRSRALHGADARAKRKRQRALSSNAVAALTAPFPPPPASSAKALLTVASDVACDDEEEKRWQQKDEQVIMKRQREYEGSAAGPRLLPPSEVLPLLLQQPQPPTPGPVSTVEGGKAAAAAAPSPAAPCPLEPVQLHSAASRGEEQAQAAQPPVSMVVAPGLGGTEADFPMLLPHHAGATPPVWGMNGRNPALPGSSIPPPPHLPRGANSPSPPAAHRAVVSQPARETISETS